MARNRFREPRRSSGRLRWFLLFVVVLAAIVGLWGALRRSPAPQVTIDSDRPAIGRAAKVTVHFQEPRWGLGHVKVELLQGDKSMVLGEKTFPRKGTYALRRGAVTPETTVEAEVGRQNVDWLQEGEVTVRATADRIGGLFRSKAPEIVEKKFPVKLRPPHLEVVSQQHYLHEGGSGVVVFRTSEPNARSGVRAGDYETPSYPLPNGSSPNDRFCLFPIPWTLEDQNQIKVFAEDAAGNRVELPFVTIYWKVPPKHDTIQVTDSFLEKVVPPIEAETPGLDTNGALVDRYVRINRDLRKVNLQQIGDIVKKSEPKFLWSGAFIQMANTAKRANFAEMRTYVYNGKPIDQETHLGLDLASKAHDAVPASNDGKVLYAGWMGIYGNAVILDHGYGLTTLYGHLASSTVKAGDAVKKGQTIAYSDSTGLAGGDHLHLEVFLNGKSVNPPEWFDAHWIHDTIGTKVPVPGV